MEKIVGKIFQDTSVNLDFSEYERCTFNNCDIYVAYGITRLKDNNFNGCRLSLSGPAKAISQIIQTFYPDTPVYFADEPKEKVFERMKKRLEKEGVLGKDFGGPLLL